MPAVKVDALEKRTEAVPYPNDSNSDFIHCRKNTEISRSPPVGARPRCAMIEQMRRDAISPWQFAAPDVGRGVFPRAVMGIFVEKATLRT
jgi:hypothetical protein